MLDWTRSPYVAAYFALESADPKNAEDPDCAVWALNAFWFKQHGLQAIRQHNPAYESLKDSVEYFHPEYLDAVFKAKCTGVCPVRPFRMHDRLALQQGLFVVSGNPDKTFVENLAAFGTDDVTKHLIRVHIPKKDRLKALTDLNRMNINRATLFPGIDGFVQSLRVNAEITFPSSS